MAGSEGSGPQRVGRAGWTGVVPVALWVCLTVPNLTEEGTGPVARREGLTWWGWCLTDGETDAQRGRVTLKGSPTQPGSFCLLGQDPELCSCGGREDQLISYFQMAWILC